MLVNPIGSRQLLKIVLFALSMLIKNSPSSCGILRRRRGFSYTEYLAGVDDGTYVNTPAPQIAIDYWELSPDARLRDVILVVRADEAHHRDVNHQFAGELA